MNGIYSANEIIEKGYYFEGQTLYSWLPVTESGLIFHTYRAIFLTDNEGYDIVQLYAISDEIAKKAVRDHYNVEIGKRGLKAYVLERVITNYVNVENIGEYEDCL